MNRKTILKFNKAKSCFQEINQINKLLAGNQKREKNEKEKIKIDFT